LGLEPGGGRNPILERKSFRILGFDPREGPPPFKANLQRIPRAAHTVIATPIVGSLNDLIELPSFSAPILQSFQPAWFTADGLRRMVQLRSLDRPRSPCGDHMSCLAAIDHLLDLTADIDLIPDRCVGRQRLSGKYHEW
jgi:hypothetical protein